MHTKQVVTRPLNEQSSTVLEVARGCTHGKCHFCRIAECQPFEMVPFEHIAEDIAEYDQLVKKPIRIMLYGGDPFVLSNKVLVPILNLIIETFPGIQSIGGYARSAGLKHKSDEDLEELASLRVTDLTSGVESGYDPAREYMEKGNTAADVVEQCARLDKAGITYSFFYLPGMCGAGRWEESGKATAECFNQCNPLRIYTHTMTPFKDTKLYREIQEGLFQQSPEHEILKEIRTMLENLDIKTYFLCTHDTNVIHFDASMPKDKEFACAAIDAHIAKTKEEALQRFRKCFR